MSKHRSTLHTALVAAGALFVYACGAPLHVAESAPRATQAQHSSPGKPTAAIAIHYELSATPDLGQPLEVRITARAAGTATDLSLELAFDDSLFVAGAPTAVAGADVNERAWIVAVTPLQEQAGYLTVTLSGLLDGQRQSRSVMIPIRTSGRKAEAQSTGVLKIDEFGETVIALPAQETIGPPASVR